MLINLKVKTLDAQTHEFSIDNEITVREFKDKVAEKTNIAADQQRIIYCGRVMVDDKQLKDYDVDGKVVHVAERPPPSQRLATTESSGSTSNNTPNERRSRGRPGAGGMRNSPLFRALDGMVLGTMAFPVNPSTNGQAPVNPLAASSSFCMNRITVARHMLDCANNIAAFLEDPSRGLNNQSLDILARGRWTMESTVVEVGITSDIPQSQQIMEMVQGAVQAALRRNGNTNVTFMQLPTVYSSSEGDGTNAAAAAPSAPEAISDGQSPADGAAASAAASAVVIEDVIDEDDDDDTPTNEQSADNNTSTTSPPAAGDTVAENATGTSSAADEGNNDTSRRRTGTRILAAVIEQMRNVQNRLNPFIEQYYEMLQSEPNFEEDDTEGRTNAQRLFDRVSEALHYMSHAQHAISDLMLDLSQPSPRFLTCRPILVEQSGYVSSNNFITPALIPAAIRPHQQQSSRNATVGATGATSNAAANTSTASSTTAARNTTATTATSTSVNNANANSANDANNSTVDDPIDDPVAWPPTINFGLPNDNADNTINIDLPSSLDNTNNTATNNANNTNNATHANVARDVPSSIGFQRQVARLLQDVVRAAPFDTEFHVHINSPNVVSIDVPIGGALAAAAAAGQNRASANTDNNAAAAAATTTADNNATTTASSSSSSSSPSASTTNDNATTTTTSPSSSAAASANGNPARVTTATLPTTSTQTRSTARPQVHIGNIPVLGMPAGWNGRVLPNNNVSSFDRFLPCNSHHVREHENASNGVTNESETRNTNPSNAGAAVGTARINRANIITRRPIRTINDILNRLRRRHSRIIVGSTLMDSLRSGNRNNTTAATSRTRLDSENTPPILRLNPLSELPPPPRSRDEYQAFHELLERTRINYSGPTPPRPTQDRRVTVHAELLEFIKTKIFEGKPINEENMPPAINRAIEWFGNSLVYLPQYEKPEYDSRHSLYNILRSTLPIAIRQLNKTPLNLNEFEQKMKEIFEQFRIRLYSVLYVCIGRANVEVYWNQLMRLLWHPIEDRFSEESVGFLTFYLSPDIPEIKDEADAQQFLVHRNAAASNASSNNDMELPLDTDVEMTEVASTSQPEVDDEPLPAVVSGSATWHRNFPNDWLPIITRDIQRQTENPPTQPPYSDAYISGMSSKRRKLIQHTKPPTEISALIADSVSKAIHNAGVGSSTSSNQSHTPDEIARVIASDASVQSSCTEAVRVNIRERLKNEPDYEPEKFPKSAKFIQK